MNDANSAVYRRFYPLRSHLSFSPPSPSLTPPVCFEEMRSLLFEWFLSRLVFLFPFARGPSKPQTCAIDISSVSSFSPYPSLHPVEPNLDLSLVNLKRLAPCVRSCSTLSRQDSSCSLSPPARLKIRSIQLFFFFFFWAVGGGCGVWFCFFFVCFCFLW